jgi:hypothetical protein
MLVCVETLVVLHCLYGRALKADRALLKSTVILKADSPESRLWVHVSLCNNLCQLLLGMMRMFGNMFDCTNRLCLIVFTLYASIRRDAPDT